MKNVTAILVDDEFSALRGLKQKVEKLFPDIEILDIFQKPEEALKGIEKWEPDIVFLDIQMPRMTGFELLSKLKEITFQVIFVTAYNEYALEALKLSAIDYILKPIDDDDLKLAINKAIITINQNRQNENNTKLVEFLTKTINKTNKIIIPTTKGVSFIPQEEILHIEGYDGYTRFHLIENTEIVSSYNLGKFEKILNTSFFKCHKSHIVNLEKVRSFENEGYIVLENNRRIPISKTNKKAFLNLFNT